MSKCVVRGGDPVTKVGRVLRARGESTEKERDAGVRAGARPMDR